MPAPHSTRPLPPPWCRGEHGHGPLSPGKWPAPMAQLPTTQGAATFLPVPTRSPLHPIPMLSPTAHASRPIPQPATRTRGPLLPARPAPLCLVILAKIPVFLPQEPAPAQVCFWLDTTQPPKKQAFCPKATAVPGRAAAGRCPAGRPPKSPSRRPPGSDQRPPRGPREARPPPANGSRRAGGYLHPAGGGLGPRAANGGRAAVAARGRRALIGRGPGSFAGRCKQRHVGAGRRRAQPSTGKHGAAGARARSPPDRGASAPAAAAAAPSSVGVPPPGGLRDPASPAKGPPRPRCPPHLGQRPPYPGLGQVQRGGGGGHTRVSTSGSCGGSTAGRMRVGSQLRVSEVCGSRGHVAGAGGLSQAGVLGQLLHPPGPRGAARRRRSGAGTALISRSSRAVAFTKHT